jgi:uncharacterized protein
MNALNWFEIPANDFARAVRFYETVLAATLHQEVIDGVPNAYLPYERPHVGGSLVHAPYVQPANNGAIVYLNAHDTATMDVMLGRVGEAGGKVIMPKTSIGQFGWMAIFNDSEGNKVGLHCNKE